MLTQLLWRGCEIIRSEYEPEKYKILMERQYHSPIQSDCEIIRSEYEPEKYQFLWKGSILVPFKVIAGL